MDVPQPSKSDVPTSFFLVAALVEFHDKTGTIKKRYVNSVTESPNSVFRQVDLGTIQAGIIKRLMLEEEIEMINIRDFVFMNLSFLGNMSPNQFFGNIVPKPILEN